MDCFASRLMACAVAVALLTAGVAQAKDDDARGPRVLPAETVIEAIRAAVAIHPGAVRDVEVEREHGRLLVTVRLLGKDGKGARVMVDPETNEVLPGHDKPHH